MSKFDDVAVRHGVHGQDGQDGCHRCAGMEARRGGDVVLTLFVRVVVPDHCCGFALGG